MDRRPSTDAQAYEGKLDGIRVIDESSEPGDESKVTTPSETSSNDNSNSATINEGLAAARAMEISAIDSDQDEDVSKPTEENAGLVGLDEEQPIRISGETASFTSLINEIDLANVDDAILGAIDRSIGCDLDFEIPTGIELKLEMRTSTEINLDLPTEENLEIPASVEVDLVISPKSKVKMTLETEEKEEIFYTTKGGSGGYTYSPSFNDISESTDVQFWNEMDESQSDLKKSGNLLKEKLEEELDVPQDGGNQLSLLKDMLKGLELHDNNKAAVQEPDGMDDRRSRPIGKSFDPSDRRDGRYETPRERLPDRDSYRESRYLYFDRERERDRDRYDDRERDRYRDRDWERDRDLDRERGRDDRYREYERERDRDCDRDREYDRDQRPRERDVNYRQSRSFSNDRDYFREFYERDRERDRRDYDREPDRDREREREPERYRERERERDRDRDRDRSNRDSRMIRDRSRDREDRYWEFDRDFDRDRDRERDRARDRERDRRERERERERDRRREDSHKDRDREKRDDREPRSSRRDSGERRRDYEKRDDRDRERDRERERDRYGDNERRDRRDDLDAENDTQEPGHRRRRSQSSPPKPDRPTDELGAILQRVYPKEEAVPTPDPHRGITELRARKRSDSLDMAPPQLAPPSPRGSPKSSESHVAARNDSLKNNLREFVRHSVQIQNAMLSSTLHDEMASPKASRRSQDEEHADTPHIIRRRSREYSIQVPADPPSPTSFTPSSPLSRSSLRVNDLSDLYLSSKQRADLDPPPALSLNSNKLSLSSSPKEVPPNPFPLFSPRRPGSPMYKRNLSWEEGGRKRMSVKDDVLAAMSALAGRNSSPLSSSAPSSPAILLRNFKEESKLKEEKYSSLF